MTASPIGRRGGRQRAVAIWRGCAALAAVSLCAALAGSARASAQDIGTEAQRASGGTLYNKYCSQCHGENGDGEGIATPHLLPRPRDFTQAKFKVRTTPSGALPTHQDLVNIIRRGMPYTSMPAWPRLTDQQVRDLAYFLTTFSPAFAERENTPEPISLPRAPRATDESVELGKKLYVDSGCVRCHGTLGRGDGPSAPTLTDDTGAPIRAADLTQSWTFRGGSSREDIFRTMSTGFNGTPMPSFLDALTPEDRWAITDYIVSLSGSNGPGYTNVVIAKRVEESIDLGNGAASFESAPVARFPIIGQIMEPGRSFHPRTTSVTVQAVYDEESIALLVRWHDMSAEKTGTNGLTLAVPPEEEQAAPRGGGGVWGDAETAPAGADAGGQDAGDSLWGDAGAAPAAPTSEFSDAVAIQIPSELPTGARKPYFLFGDAQNAVDLLFFDLARPEPLQFTARGSGDITAADNADVSGVASYEHGEWSVIFKRPLRAASGAAFSPTVFTPIAFSVWDGLTRERGNRRGLTLWYSVYLEPEHVPSAVGPMLTTALVILGLEIALIVWVRRSYASQGGEVGGQRTEQPAGA